MSAGSRWGWQGARSALIEHETGSLEAGGKADQPILNLDGRHAT
jgi:hypothetical protein